MQIKDLSISYHGAVLFKDATFSLEPKEKCGLVGRNGSGKSTLFRLLTGAEEPDSGTISKRSHYRLGMLDQHIRFSQPTLLEEAALGLRPEDEGNLYKAEKILFGLGFSEQDMSRSLEDFSGGYQLRVHLAKVLISEPDCLLLDEPTNYLDIVSIRWFTRFLRNWKGEFILITHDREFMDAVSTHTMGIHRNKIMKVAGGTVPFFEQIVLQEEIHERTRQNLEKKRAQSQEFIDRFGAKASKAAQAQSRQKMLDRIPVLEKLKDLYHLDFHFNEAPFPGRSVLEAKNLEFSFVPNVPLIQDFSLEVEKGERVAIIGKNGRGKSTILRLLAESLTPQAGSLKVSERTRIGYFGQTNIERLHPKHTIEEEIATANTRLNRTEVKAICGLMMFSGAQAEKVTSVLSGGEKSRVLLGKILASECNLLLLDEPTHHLDMESIEALIDALEDFEGSVVIVSHSELILKRLQLNKIVICHEGSQELFLGNYEEFLEKRGWQGEGEVVKPVKEMGVESRQERAERVQARSKALKPIEREIAREEELIAKREAELQQAQHAAMTASSKEMQGLLKDIALKQKALEENYERLEEWLKKRESL